MFSFPTVLALAGLVLGLVGSILLALSLNRVIDALALATDAHDVAFEGILNSRPNEPVIRFTGTDKHVERGRAHAAGLTRLGLWLLAISFAFQGAALLVPSAAGYPLPTPSTAAK
jgi:hypothetical protein